jgi:translation initiation factor IF-2
MAGKVLRLSKVAKELNVGISTIVDFLSGKGIEIDSNPNTKIEENAFDMLSNQFAADQSVKEKSKQASMVKEKKETISLRDAKEEEVEQEQEDDDVELDLNSFKNPIVEPKKPVAPVETSNDEVEPEKIVAEEPVQQYDFSAPPKSEQAPLAEGEVRVSVVGKIDLDKINSKTRPDKKKKVDRKAEAIKQKAKPEYKQNPQQQKPAQAKPVVVEEKKVEPKEPIKVEFIKAQSNKLSGPTVVGKIELPVDKPRVKVDKAKDKDKDAADKKKRKRIKKVHTDRPNPNNPQNQSTGRAKTLQKKGAPKPQATEEDIQKEIKDTLARLSGTGKSKASKIRRSKRDERANKREREAMEAELDSGVLKLTEFVTVSELASMMDVSPTQVISSCMSLGIFVSINQRIDAETITVVADEFGFEVEFVSAEVQDAIATEADLPEDLLPRSPIVTVMGHVDHGKTSLLDRIRNADVIAGEAGGITQHIGAYSVTLESGKKITFLDTPGHEAFTAMRARGAQVTDIAIIIVAADDDVMPQTKEAISHAQAAGVPMVFAINKIDRPAANPDKIREQLSQMNILVEEWGGKYQCQEISAKQGINIEELLEKVLLEAEMLELTANPNKRAVGTIIESSLDKGRGYVTNLLVEAGTLKVGDVILAGRFSGRVRAMHNEHGKSVKEAGPSVPVSILGINGAPSAGDKFNIMTDEREARTIATKREQLYREQGLRTQKHITLDEIGRRLAIGDFKELNLIVKGDVDGSIEALSDSLLKLSTDQIQVNIVHKGVGAITENDVNLASASDAIIVAFQVRPSLSARKLAENEQIDIRMYSVIYKAIDEIKAAMEGMLSPDIEEKIVGSAEVRETFDITKVGTIAGCFVLEGIIKRNSKIRLIRDGIVLHTGSLGSLKRFKDDVKEVKHGYECGLNIDRYNNIEVGDTIEAFEEVEVARKL